MGQTVEMVLSKQDSNAMMEILYLMMDVLPYVRAKLCINVR